MIYDVAYKHSYGAKPLCIITKMDIIENMICIMIELEFLEV